MHLVRAEAAEPAHYGHDLIQLVSWKSAGICEKLERPLVQFMRVSLADLGSYKLVNGMLVGALYEVLKGVL